MKKYILQTLVILFIAFNATAQQGINYKAIITNANGDALVNTAVTIQFTILENGTNEIYKETHTPTTDVNGIIIVNIGEGSVISGDFDNINWGGNPHFLKTEIDKGDGLTDMGSTEFKTVPYALYAETAKNVLINTEEPAPCEEIYTLIDSLYKELYTTINISGAYTALLDPPVTVDCIPVRTQSPVTQVSFEWNYVDPLIVEESKRDIIFDLYLQTPYSTYQYSNLLVPELIINDIEFVMGMYHWQVIAKDYFNNISITPVQQFTVEPEY